MKSPERQYGLSLVELMVGILLSSILLLGVLQIFDSNRSTMATQTAFSSVQENGRFAIDFLARELRVADYWGCVPDQASIANHLDSAKRSEFQSSIGGGGVQGVDNAGAQEKVGEKVVVESTDILILSGTVDACSGSGRILDIAGGSLQVTSNCALEEGQVLLVANCQGGDVFTLTGISGAQGDGSSRTLLHATGSINSVWVENASDTLQHDYGSEATLLLPYRHTFFISENDAGSPSLFMLEEGEAAPRELVSGIEDMQVFYGRDTNGDDIIDVWQESGDAAQMSEVVAVKLQLLVASSNNAAIGEQTVDLDGDGNETTYTDGRLRKLYTTTVKVRNRGSM